MAFTQSDGTAGAFNEDGSVVDAAYKGTFSAGTNSDVDGNVFDLKANVPDDPKLPPVKEGVNNTSAHAGTWNILDAGTAMSLGDSSAKMGSSDPGGDGSNNTNTTADVVDSDNYKTLVNAGISPGDPLWDSSFVVQKKRAWDISTETDTAAALKSSQTDESQGTSFVFSMGTSLETVVYTSGPGSKQCPCEAGSVDSWKPEFRKPLWRLAMSPYELINKNAADPADYTEPHYFCTGAEEYDWTVGETTQPKRPVYCMSQFGTRDEVGVLTIGFSPIFRNTVGSEGRCYLRQTVNVNKQTWLADGISGSTGYQGDCTWHCGNWQYRAQPIDNTGGMVGSLTKIREGDFQMFSETELKCNTFTRELYEGLCGEADPPTYLECECDYDLPYPHFDCDD